MDEKRDKEWNDKLYEWFTHYCDEDTPYNELHTIVLGAIQTERQKREELVRELRKDKERLDFLDRCNLSLNEYYQTNYGWKLILNHNVTRLMSERGLDFIDLHDSEGGNKKFKSCREAIDEALTQPNNPK